MTRHVQKISSEWLLARAPEPLLVVEHEGVIVAANPAAGQLCGCAPGALVGVGLRDILPEYESAWIQEPRSFFGPVEYDSDHASSQTLSLRPMAGPSRKVQFIASPLLDQDGCFAVQLHDLSAQEQALGVERMFAALYVSAAKGAAVAEVFEQACRDLAKLLHLPLVLMAKKQDNGAVTLEATSTETDLWAELQKLPERWDGTVAGNGPAGTALRLDTPVIKRVDEEGFLPWRRAAERGHVRSAGAWPLSVPGDTYALVLFAQQDDLFEREFNRRLAARLVTRLEDFLARYFQLQEQRLVARALECAGNGAFITDLEGTILWSNESFSRMCGHPRHEVKGRNPRLLKSGRQGLRYYRNLWSTIRSGKVWSGETVDHDRDGMPYTIRQTISPVALHDRVSHYLSVHDDISRQKSAQQRHDLRQPVDADTGLLTRAAFEDAVRQAIATPDASFELVLVSLSEFQRTTAPLGVEAEELVAATLGERVRGAVEVPHLAGRLAPGEYALLLKGKDGHTAVLDRLRADLAAPISVQGDGVQLNVRFGGAHYPSEGQALDELLRAADRKLADQPIARARRDPGTTQPGRARPSGPAC